MSDETRKNVRTIRWANVVVRGVHQVAVVGLGAAVLGAPVSLSAFGIAVVLSGVVLLALEVIDKPTTIFEASGLAIVVKLALVGWLALVADAPTMLFWFIVAWSTLFAHAPGAFRHARLFQRRSQP